MLSGGAICMELLTPDGWSSAYTVEAIIHQTMSMMVKVRPSPSLVAGFWSLPRDLTRHMFSWLNRATPESSRGRPSLSPKPRHDGHTTTWSRRTKNTGGSRPPSRTDSLSFNAIYFLCQAWVSTPMLLPGFPQLGTREHGLVPSPRGPNNCRIVCDILTLSVIVRPHRVYVDHFQCNKTKNTLSYLNHNVLPNRELVFSCRSSIKPVYFARQTSRFTGFCFRQVCGFYFLGDGGSRRWAHDSSFVATHEPSWGDHWVSMHPVRPRSSVHARTPTTQRFWSIDSCSQIFTNCRFSSGHSRG